MQTECISGQLEFEGFDGRRVVAAFDGGAVTSDAGALLLRETDRAIRLIERVAACFSDGRDPGQLIHALPTLVGQRIVAIALGYEDVNDHDKLRFDPVLALFGDSLEAKRKDCAPLAGKSTMNRLEHAPGDGCSRYHKIGCDREALQDVFVDVFLDAHGKAPREIVLDLDATDDPLHGHQEGRFFHGYFDCYCYLPLYVFCGRQLLAAKLRRSNIDAAAGAKDEVARIIARIRRRWPKVRILLRADSGFAREELMAWCEDLRVDYLFGLARNSRLLDAIAIDLAWAQAEHRETGKPARRFKDFFYATGDSWSRRPRVIGKAEHLAKGANPRFIVTSLKRKAIDAQTLYEQVSGLLCPRRNGEPDQGMPARSVGRPHLDSDNGRQPAAAVVLVVRLRPTRGLAPDRSAAHRAGAGDLRHHPPEAAQTRRPRHRLRPSHQDRHRFGLPASRRVRPGACQAARTARLSRKPTPSSE